MAMNLNYSKYAEFFKENQIAVKLKWKLGLLDSYF
jgi:hypothetical protein